MAAFNDLLIEICEFHSLLAGDLDVSPIPDYVDISQQFRLASSIGLQTLRSDGSSRSSPQNRPQIRRRSSQVTDTNGPSDGGSRTNFQQRFPVFKFSGPNKSQCVVCYADFKYGQTIKALSCLHKFHVRCIDPWLQKEHKCPVCRYDLTKVVDIQKL